MIGNFTQTNSYLTLQISWARYVYQSILILHFPFKFFHNKGKSKFSITKFIQVGHIMVNNEGEHILIGVIIHSISLHVYTLW